MVVLPIAVGYNQGLTSLFVAWGLSQSMLRSRVAFEELSEIAIFFCDCSAS